MQDTRAKLIELIKESLKAMGGVCNDSICKHCKYEKYNDDCGFAIRADYLIANGVTINRCTEDTPVAYKMSTTEPMTNCQQWIPVAERLPKDNTNVLAHLRIGEESRTYPAFFAHGMWWDCIFNEPTCNYTTHWMPLPPPPKGE